MRIDCRIVDGAQGGLTFDFIPCKYAFNEENNYDRDGPDVFSVTEQAFLFIESSMARVIPSWTKGYHHWGVTCLSKEMWLEVFLHLSALRHDLRNGVHPKIIIQKYTLIPSFLPSHYKFHRKELLDFLDNFESRVSKILISYPYIIVGGV